MLQQQSLKVNIIVLFFLKGVIMNINKRLIGQKIKAARKKSKLTQSELAEMVNLSDKHIGRIEVGKYMPNFLNFMKILEALNLNISDFGLNTAEVSNPNRRELLDIIYTATDKDINLYLKLIKTLQDNR